jgi:hypothetical protein
MGYKKVKKEFTVWLKEDQWPYPEGSCLHVEKESKNFYFGTHSNMGGSMKVKFSKSVCTKTNPMKWISDLIKKNKKK